MARSSNSSKTRHSLSAELSRLNAKSEWLQGEAALVNGFGPVDTAQVPVCDEPWMSGGPTVMRW